MRDIDKTFINEITWLCIVFVLLTALTLYAFNICFDHIDKLEKSNVRLETKIHDMAMHDEEVIP